MQEKETSIRVAAAEISAAEQDAGGKGADGQKKSLIEKTEDQVFKFAMQFFAKELLDYLGVQGKAVRSVPTEFVHLDRKHIYEDFNFEMEDGSFCHMEFESDYIRTDDLRRFRTYEAITSETFKRPVITYVVCSAGAVHPMSSIKEGINTYKVKVIRLKARSADRVFSRLKKKSSGEVTMADLVPVVFTPLMAGRFTVLERVKKGIEVLERTYANVSKVDLQQLQAAFLELANRMLDENEKKELEEVYGMNTLVRGVIEAGIRREIQQNRSAILRLVTCMLGSSEDASKVPLLEKDEELCKEMMEKYHIVIG